MASSGSSPGDIFDVRKVRRLVELMNEHDLAEIDLAARRPADSPAPRFGLARVGAIRSRCSPALPPPPQAAASAMTAAPPPKTARTSHVIKSPMVGTFYAAPNPESPPFVKVGDHVGPETTVCIVEAMKVFNEIPAESPARSSPCWSKTASRSNSVSRCSESIPRK